MSRTLSAPGTQGHYVVTNSSITHTQFVFGAVLIYIALVAVAIFSGFKFEYTSRQRMEPMSGASTNMVFKSDPGQAITDYTPPVPIDLPEVKPGYGPSYQSDQFERLKSSLESAGVVVPVSENGKNVPREIVAMAIEDNKNFYPRFEDEFELAPKQPELDAGGIKPRSMFENNVPSFLGLGN